MAAAGSVNCTNRLGGSDWRSGYPGCIFMASPMSISPTLPSIKEARRKGWKETWERLLQSN